MTPAWPRALSMLLSLVILALAPACGDSGPCTLAQFLADPLTPNDDLTGIVILENTSRDDQIVGVEIFSGGPANGNVEDSHELDLAPGEQETFQRDEGFYDLLVFWAEADPSLHSARVRSNECLTVHAGGGG